MTNKIICNAEDLTAIADAVRASNGSTNTYNVPELSAAAVNAIGNGGGAAIVDVTELPTADIDESVFYRLTAAEFYYGGDKVTEYRGYIVNELPKDPLPVTDATMTELHVYYNLETEAEMGYIDDMMSYVFGIPTGWYVLTKLAEIANIQYGGLVYNKRSMTRDDTLYLLISLGAVYHYIGEWEYIGSSGVVGMTDIADHAEVFNSYYGDERNVASGSYSHAEGKFSEASGICSHAEGKFSEASGSCSHAEGENTEARGDYSHAEGNSVIAGGHHSHAEGYKAFALGVRSHAEGYNTIASGDAQHVQGKYNIDDSAGVYAHIVGNGTSIADRSNAHTLDWNGNAWFAGGIELTSPNGTRYRFTVSDDGTLTATVVTV